MQVYWLTGHACVLCCSLYHLALHRTPLYYLVTWRLAPGPPGEMSLVGEMLELAVGLEGQRFLTGWALQNVKDVSRPMWIPICP